MCPPTGLLHTRNVFLPPRIAVVREATAIDRNRRRHTVIDGGDEAVGIANTDRLAVEREWLAFEVHVVETTEVAADCRGLDVRVPATVRDVPRDGLVFLLVSDTFGDRELASRSGGFSARLIKLSVCARCGIRRRAGDRPGGAEW